MVEEAKKAMSEAKKKANELAKITSTTETGGVSTFAGDSGATPGTTGSWTPGGTYTAPAKQRDYSTHQAYGLREGGLATMFTRRR